MRAGVLERFGLDRRHLALACASHGGSPDHVAVVAEVLEACGLVEGALGCGPELPRDPRAAEGVRPSRIRHNCSGKHAFGLARCLAEGWPLDGYFRAGHALQGAMRDCVAEACGVAGPSEEATDGCGMRTFAVPLAALARAFGGLAGGGLGPSGDRCAAAMRAYPELVAFEGAIDTELMRAEPGLVAKIGAEGVLAVGLADGRGLALKVRDGSLRAVPPAGVALARAELGLAAAGARGARRRPDRQLPRRPRGRAGNASGCSTGSRPQFGTAAGPVDLGCRARNRRAPHPRRQRPPGRRLDRDPGARRHRLLRRDVGGAEPAADDRARRAVRPARGPAARAARRAGWSPAARATSSSSRGASSRPAGSRSSSTSTAAAAARSRSAWCWRSRSPGCCTRCAARWASPRW